MPALGPATQETFELSLVEVTAVFTAFGWFPRGERGLALGLLQTAVPAGAAIASLSLAPPAAAAGLDAALYALAGAMLAASVAAAVWLRDGECRRIGGPAGGQCGARPAHLAAQLGIVAHHVARRTAGPPIRAAPHIRRSTSEISTCASGARPEASRS